MKACIIGVDGREIEGTKALLWGNNAAWICTKCDQLVGSRTGKREKTVSCDCGRRYILVSAQNQYGEYNQGAAKSVRAL